MAKKGNGGIAKREAVDTKTPSSRSTPLAEAGITTAPQFAAYMSALMTDLATGALPPENGNAICNAGGKLLKIVEMQHKYGKANGMPLKLA